MKITWDPAKRIANIVKHRMDFATLTEDIFANALVISAKRGRYKAIRVDANGVISVVFVTLGLEAISVISMLPGFEERKAALQCQKLKRSCATLARI